MIVSPGARQCRGRYGYVLFCDAEPCDEVFAKFAAAIKLCGQVRRDAGVRYVLGTRTEPPRTVRTGAL